MIYCKFGNFHATFISRIFDSQNISESISLQGVLMQSIKLIVICYKRELYFHEAMNSPILAKNKFSPIFLDLQYNMYMV